MDISYSRTFDSAYALVPGGYVLQKGGVFMPTEEAAEAKSHRTLRELYQSQKDKGEVYDWEKARDSGFLERVRQGSTENTEQSSESITGNESERSNDVYDFPPEKEENVKEETEEIHKTTVRTIPFVKYCLLLVSFGAMFVSWYITHKVQVTVLGSFSGTVFACTITLLQAIALAVFGSMLIQKKWGYAAIVFSVFVVVELYSMSNTVKVFYDSYTQSSSRVEITDAQEAILTEDKKQKEESVKLLSETIQKYSEQGRGVQNMVDRYNVAVTEYNKSRDTYLAYVKAKGSQGKVTEYSVFEKEVGKLLRVSGDAVSMFFACFPALFIDLLSPVCLALATNGLTEKKEE